MAVHGGRAAAAEDTMFARLIHEIAGPVLPRAIPGLHAIHAVDAAGVHPLLLAMGSERYVPYEHDRRPAELLTLANAVLGHGQLSLAKYLFVVAKEDNPELKLDNVGEVFRHVLERVDWSSDLHFQTCTTINTLDYSGDRLNRGSKVVIAAAGKPQRVLPVGLDARMRLPEDQGFRDPRVFLPGILVVEGPPCGPDEEGRDQMKRFTASFTVAMRSTCSLWWSWWTTAVSPRERSTTFSGRLSRGATLLGTSMESNPSRRKSTGGAGARWSSTPGRSLIMPRRWSRIRK